MFHCQISSAIPGNPVRNWTCARSSFTLLFVKL